MRDLERVCLLACVALVLSLLPAPASAQRESGIQCTSDGSGVLINKEVSGTESWVITWRNNDGYTTGNVLGNDGSVNFLACNLDSIAAGMVFLQCDVSSSCSATSCPPYSRATPEPIGIPCSFFSAPCSPIPGQPGSTNSRTCAGSPPEFPYDSDASCAQFAAAGGCATYEYTTNSCVVRNCCTPMDCPS